jgi:hypothetical protein
MAGVINGERMDRWTKVSDEGTYKVKVKTVPVLN